jgi:hypothetical protein
LLLQAFQRLSVGGLVLVEKLDGGIDGVEEIRMNTWRFKSPFSAIEPT